MTVINDQTRLPDHASHSPSEHTDRRGTASAERRLRTVLRLNAASSAAAGVAMTVAPDTIDVVLQTGQAGWVRAVGLSLLPFSLVVAWLSTSTVDRLRAMTPTIVVADTGWVVGSLVTVALGWYSGAGIALVVGMAAVVDLWAVLQWSAWRRLATR